MLFAIGLITGIALCTFAFCVIAFFRSPIERALLRAKREIEHHGPRETGSIYIPPDDAELAREDIIEENTRNGRDTPLSELR